MAGKHRTDGTDYSGKLLLRMPETLKFDLETQAQQRGVSLNQLIVERLMERKYYRPRMTPEMRRKLMALEPKPGDTRSVKEIADQIALARGERLVTPSIDKELEEVKIDWFSTSDFNESF